MNKPLAFFGLFFVQIAACSGAPPASTPQATSTTVCAVSLHGKEMDGAVVRFRATYITDLRHGIFLKDCACPSIFIERGSDDANVDPSVSRFDEVVKGSVLDVKLREFHVEISGRFTWSPGDMLHGVPVAAPNGRIRPHGVIAIEKVWSYERVVSEKSK